MKMSKAQREAIINQQDDPLLREATREAFAILEEVEAKTITAQQARARFYQLAGRLEQTQWDLVQDLRTRGELGQFVADQMEKDLRKGSGNA